MGGLGSVSHECAVYVLSKHLRCPGLHRESKHLGILHATEGFFIVDWKPELTDATSFAIFQLCSSYWEVSDCMMLLYKPWTMVLSHVLMVMSVVAGGSSAVYLQPRQGSSGSQLWGPWGHGRKPAGALGEAGLPGLAACAVRSCSLRLTALLPVHLPASDRSHLPQDRPGDTR